MSRKENAVKPIIIGYDGSDGAKRAVEFAGRNFGAREAIVVTAFEGLLSPMHGDVVSVDGATRSRVEATADEGASLARAAGLVAEARTVFAAEKAWQAIIETADEVDAPRSPLKRWGPPRRPASTYASGPDATVRSRQRELRRRDDVRLLDRNTCADARASPGR